MTQFQLRNQRIKDTAQLKGCPSPPVSQCRAIYVDALTAHDLGLAIKRKMVGIFGNQNMCDCCFRR